MKQSRIVLTLALLLATTSGARAAFAQQALPAAARTLQLSAFGGVSGVFTGLADGKNLSITAGADLGLPPWRGVRPAIEVRGTYPMDGGHIDAQKSILFGARFDFLLSHRLRPYADFLLGRGQIDYESGGFVFANNIYELTTTPVYSPGGGFDYDLTRSLALKVDAQVQHWDGVPTPSGSLYSEVGTVGVVYRFNFGRYPRR